MKNNQNQQPIKSPPRLQAHSSLPNPFLWTGTGSGNLPLTASQYHYPSDYTLPRYPGGNLSNWINVELFVKSLSRDGGRSKLFCRHLSDYKQLTASFPIPSIYTIEKSMYNENFIRQIRRQHDSRHTHLGKGTSSAEDCFWLDSNVLQEG